MERTDATPAWVAPLLARVDAAFARTGVATPGWPDPHPDRAPLDEEYSRVTARPRYRILDTRLDAWSEVLVGGGVAQECDVPAQRWLGMFRSPDDIARVRRLDPVRAGGLSLLCAFPLVDGDLFGLDLGIAAGEDVPVLLTIVPDCGCDACDSGSADLLRTLDESLLAVMCGGVVHARRGDDQATRLIDGWESTGGDHSAWFDGSRAVPRGVRRWVGEPWLPAQAGPPRAGTSFASSSGIGS